MEANPRAATGGYGIRIMGFENGIGRVRNPGKIEYETTFKNDIMAGPESGIRVETYTGLWLGHGLRIAVQKL